MFKKHDNQMPMYFENQMLERLYYQLDEQERKIRNLNNRLRRVEGFLGLRQDEKYQEEIRYDD